MEKSVGDEIVKLGLDLYSIFGLYVPPRFLLLLILNLNSGPHTSDALMVQDGSGFRQHMFSVRAFQPRYLGMVRIFVARTDRAFAAGRRPRGRR